MQGRNLEISRFLDFSFDTWRNWEIWDLYLILHEKPLLFCRGRFLHSVIVWEWKLTSNVDSRWVEKSVEDQISFDPCANLVFQNSKKNLCGKSAHIVDQLTLLQRESETKKFWPWVGQVRLHVRSCLRYTPWWNRVSAQGLHPRSENRYASNGFIRTWVSPRYVRNNLALLFFQNRPPNVRTVAICYGRSTRNAYSVLSVY